MPPLSREGDMLQNDIQDKVTQNTKIYDVTDVPNLLSQKFLRSGRILLPQTSTPATASYVLGGQVVVCIMRKD